MPEFIVPEELVRMVAERRVIPFVGAGFSAAHGFPDWNTLLEQVSEEVQSGSGEDDVIAYEEIVRACGDDNLQIAEYLYLRSGSSIGPLRHVMSRAMNVRTRPLESTAHVELVNLGAPHVYTTNYDDLIEDTYKALGEKVAVIALPRHVARAEQSRVELIKYHGDLRYDSTLVLTESQYYARLDFESPMDLKFRSDLLGRSVLFMGYSFRDINIRVIWFKLMEMMKDVPARDRLPSYIVRLESDPVRETLYDAVGLRTIVLDPSGEAKSSSDRSELLAAFLLELSSRAAPYGARPDRGTAFLSSGVLEAIDTELQRPGGRRSRARPAADGPLSGAFRIEELLDVFAMRTPPEELVERAHEVLGRIAEGDLRLGVTVPIVSTYSDVGPSSGLTLLAARGLMRSGIRVDLLDKDWAVNWKGVWAGRISTEQAQELLDQVEQEIRGHEQDEYDDDDLAFAIDIAHRVASGTIARGRDKDLRKRANELIVRAAEMLPSALKYKPSIDEAPAPTAIVEDIRQRYTTGEQAAGN